MKKYTVIVSFKVRLDIAKLRRYIKQDLNAPDTAANYIKGLHAAIQNLSFYAGSIGANEHVQAMFGINARHITYKKMAIVYIVEGNLVYVKRVIASALIH